jgi:mono/diheme cytochrome c family protein
VSAIRLPFRAFWPGSGRRAHRGATILIALIVASLAFTLLFIGASSPYTHSNLNAAYDDSYTRTDQIVLGAAEPFGGLSPSVGGADPLTRGRNLFVTQGCVGCHGLAAEGGAVAKAIAGVDAQLLVQRVREGTSGMPPFSTEGLTDAELAEILTYLRSLPPAQ